MAKAKTQKTIRVTLTRSLIGSKPEQRATAKALGLGRVHSQVEHTASDTILGMVRVIGHLVTVEEVK